MNHAETGSDGPSSEMLSRLQGALNLARAASIGGFIPFYWALVGLVFTLAEFRVEGAFGVNSNAMWNLALVNVLASDREISETLGIAIACGIVAELTLILFLLYRIRRGSFLSAVALFVLYLIELSAKLPMVLYADTILMVSYGCIFLGLAMLVGVGVAGTWEFRKLIRKVRAATPSEPDYLLS